VEIKYQLDAVGILFPHINEDARSKSHQIPSKCLSAISRARKKGRTDGRTDGDRQTARR